MNVTPAAPERFWDRSAAALALALVFTSATRLAITDWTDFLTATQTLGLLGAALGLALGYSQFSLRAARWLAFGYGLLLVPSQLLRALEERADWLGDDVWTLLLRLEDSIAQLFRSQPVYDSIFFLTLVTFAFWSIGVYSGYQLTRHRNFLGMILPAGVTMLAVQVYDNYAPLRAWALALYIFLALLLMGRVYYLENKQQWRHQRIFFTADMEGDISRVALGIAATAIFIAWSFPGVLNSVAPAAKAWSEWTRPLRDWLADAVSALDSPYKKPASADFYAETLYLGSSAPTSPQPVFFVSVDNAPLEGFPRYYWRGRVYDTYLDGRWQTAETTPQIFSPAADRLLQKSAIRQYDSRFTFTINFREQSLLYLPPGSLWTDREGSWELASANAREDSPPDLMAWMSEPPLQAGEKYRARALMLNPSEQELRAAGEEYPNWARERYLQIPPQLASQFAEIARRVTRGQPTPYDKANAITAFLRAEMAYTLKLEQSPPEGEDPVLWALRDYKKGFCMYAASAEVLLLRSLGIPARMAVGFAQGTYNIARRRYVVARADSHAWAEVYFPDIGWVEFEPTGNQNPLARPPVPLEALSRLERLEQLAAQNADAAPNQLEPALSQEDPAKDPNLFAMFLPFLYGILAIASVVTLVFFSRRQNLSRRLPLYLVSRYVEKGRKPPRWLSRWARWVALQPIQRAFHAVDLSLRWLKISQPAQATPRERAVSLSLALPAARDSILVLRQEHEAALFTQHPADLNLARRAAWSILREAWRARLFKGKIKMRSKTKNTVNL